jgi:sugar/nucleoside kinase (ribokinase family)
MNNTPEFRNQTAAALADQAGAVAQFRAFIGLDGFVDNILHVVDKRESPETYTRLGTIGAFAQRLAAAAGQSTNVELVSQMTKLGGNGPIMGNALASLGLPVTYLGVLGYPNLHPVFADFAKRAQVHSIAEPGYTDAVEFTDGKIMLGKHQSLREMNWENIVSRFGREQFIACVQTARFVGFVNWTMLTLMSGIWEAILKEVCPALTGPRRTLFIDLADPEKRTGADVLHALELITAFQQHFDVLLGLNEKEACEVAGHLKLDFSDRSPVGLGKLAEQIRLRVPVNTVVVHPVTFAVTASASGVNHMPGPFTAKPLITTGAGDHFNSGFCLGKLLGLDNAASLLCGKGTSGYYVRTAKSPSITDLAEFLRHWPTD